MQHEKFYDLHTTIFYIRNFSFQDRQNFERSNCDRAKNGSITFWLFLKTIIVTFTVQTVELFTLQLVAHLVLS